MRVGEMLAAVVVLLLAIYGCAALIRRAVLWVIRCPACAFCCRLAVPYPHTALAPLVRCLESRTVWNQPDDCRHTLLLLSDEREENTEEMERILREAPSVIPVTADQLAELLPLLAKDA